MSKGKTSVALLVGVSCVGSAFAQGSFLVRAQSGYAATAATEVGSEISAEGVSVGYSSKGNVDAVVSVSHYKFLSPYPFQDYFNLRWVAGTSFSVKTFAHVLKESSTNVPISLAIISGCEFGSYYAPPNPRSTALLVEDFHFIYGLMACRNYYLASSVYVQPAIGFEYSEGYGFVHSYWYDNETESHFTRTGFAGIALAVKTSGRETIIIRPTLMTSERTPAIQVEAGIVLTSP